MFKMEGWKALSMLVAAGMIGGAVSRAIDLIPRTNAQIEKSDQVLKAGSFEVVDGQGHTRATLTFDKENQTTTLNFYNNDGVAPVLSLSNSGQGNASLQLGKRPQVVYLTNSGLQAWKDNKIVWSAP